MQTPNDQTITLTYASHPHPNAKLRWTARLTFPPGASAETPLELTLTDGNDEPIENGVFELAGERLKIANGKATIIYRAFVKGINSPGLWLHLAGTKPIPGGLTFK